MPSASSHTAEDLLITVYLDTSALLDLLATVEDGFTLVERVTSGQSTGVRDERDASAELSSPGLLSFFKVGLSGKLARTSTEGVSGTTESELTHTYGSLLNRLRRYLISETLVEPARFATESALEVGAFVEFAGVVRPNPFTASFEQLRRMLGFAELAVALGDQQPPPAGSQKNPRRSGQRSATTTNPQTRELNELAGFLEQLTKDVEREGTNTIVMRQGADGYAAVLTIFEGYLRDRSMSELLNREFRVLGKVARHLPVGSGEGVDLLASSGVAGFPPEVLASLTEMIGEMSGSGAAQVATPAVQIAPPAIEIVPIAIYL